MCILDRFCLLCVCLLDCLFGLALLCLLYDDIFSFLFFLIKIIYISNQIIGHHFCLSSHVERLDKHGKSSLVGLVAANERVAVHEDAAVDAGLVAELLVAQAAPLGGQRETIDERVLALWHTLDAPRVVGGVLVHGVLDLGLECLLLLQVEQVRLPRRVAVDAHNRAARINLQQQQQQQQQNCV